jgi:hypothetical protein
VENEKIDLALYNKNNGVIPEMKEESSSEED